MAIEILQAKLDNLCTFLNDDRTYPINPLLKMAIYHFQFEAIHTFRDGNGRTGRVANIYVLTQKGLLDYSILYLSRYIVENKEDYYSALAGVSQRGDWLRWVTYMLEAVAQTARLTHEKINRIIATKDTILQVIANQTTIHLTDDRTYAENTARDYLNRLTELDILERSVVSGNHYYVNRELYHILAE